MQTLFCKEKALVGEYYSPSSLSNIAMKTAGMKCSAFRLRAFKNAYVSVVERELNDDYQPKSVRINKAGKKVRGKDLEWQPKSIFMNPHQFKDSASTGTGIQLWW